MFATDRFRVPAASFALLLLGASGLRAAPVLKGVSGLPRLAPLAMSPGLPGLELAAPSLTPAPALTLPEALPAEIIVPAAAPEPLGVVRAEPERRPAAAARTLFSSLRAVEERVRKVPEGPAVQGAARLRSAFDDIRFLRNGADGSVVSAIPKHAR